MNFNNMNELMGMLQNPDAMKQMMQKEAFEDEETGHTYSQADLVADVINILRMDTKRLGAAAGVDVEIARMTPDKAAELIQNLAHGEGMELIDVFDDIEDQRMSVLTALEDEETVEEYMATKRRMLYSIPDDSEALDYAEEGEDED